MTDKEQLYNLEDQENQDEPLYEIEDEDLEEEGQYSEDEAEQVEKKKTSPIGVLFKTMFTPVEGWKALKRARFTNEDFASRCFYPLIALAAFCEGALLFYEANTTFPDWAMKGLATFTAFFFGYFSLFPVGSILFPKKSRDVLKKDICKQLVMLSMSTLAMFKCIMSLLPLLDPVLVFLPIWTIYLVTKGMKVLRVPKEVENSTTGFLCLLIIGLPIFWYWIMEEFLLKWAL